MVYKGKFWDFNAGFCGTIDGLADTAGKKGAPPGHAQRIQYRLQSP